MLYDPILLLVLPLSMAGAAWIALLASKVYFEYRHNRIISENGRKTVHCIECGEPNTYREKIGKSLFVQRCDNGHVWHTVISYRVYM